MRSGIRPALLGSAFGMAVTFASARVLASFVFEVSPTDPRIHLITTILLLAVVLVAMLAPALRAMRVDPTRILLRN